MARTLVIPDIHTKHSIAEAIIQHEPHDKLVLLGDYFDDWGDSPGRNAATAEWLVGKLTNGAVALWGNHDQSYFGGLPCSGYDYHKQMAILPIMFPHLNKLQLVAEVDGYLLSHAGLTKELWDKYEGNPPYTEALRMLLDKQVHPLADVGGVRGGVGGVKGGLTWCDWREFVPISGVKQVFGHTEAYLTRSIGDNHCIDTRLHHYVVIDDGHLVIKETPGE